MVHVFFVGGTGHIGGAVLDQLLQKYAHTNVTVLVRDEAKAARLGTVYPQVECVVGDAGDLEVLEKCHAIIHTSGASLIWDEPTGSKDARWWDDIIDIQDICAFEGAAHTHAMTDKIVRDAAPYVNVAIISPGFVGGMSPSIEHPTPITMPAILLTARAFKSGWQIAGGQNTHAWIHVLDLARMYMILVGKAIDGVCESEPFPIWGPDAYYFGTSEDISFRKFIKHLVPVLKKQRVIESTEIKSVSVAEAARASIAGSDYDPNTPPPPLDTWALHIAIMYGINRRIGASRMKRLGWNAEMGTIVDSFPQVVAEHLKREKLSDRN
ncbi:hypothetical protein CSHISOI_01305 [Colletotrichum shisoi]|uniref:NAD(P)-binding domain-containing protein n=1 Tax=Colletotrichum shisoi TaxID=2078593 RepID=A0A5Q4C437_9PEZI|nr:hypothetical protein CSHISOI_01305 [Colletotrichum shisoi]